MKTLIRYGIEAPSGHNTQPWTFEAGEEWIHIHPDFSRALPVVDKDHHALYISLGCAAENIVIAATDFGLETAVELFENNKGHQAIRLSFNPAKSRERDGLIDYIESRQSTRNEYADSPVPREDLEQLYHSFDFDGIGLKLLHSPAEIEELRPLIIEGSNRQFEDENFVKELVHWIRFTKRTAQSTGDGIWASSMGMPNVGRFLGKIVMKYFVSAKSEAARWNQLIDATAGFALFLASEHDRWHWVKLGRAFQRFALTATELNISHAHVNMPCEVPEVRRKMAEQFHEEDKHPLLLIRYGYSDKMPYSFRRPLGEVLIDRNA